MTLSKNLVHTPLQRDIKPLYFASHFKRPACLNSSIKPSGSINEFPEDLSVTNRMFHTAREKLFTARGVSNNGAFRWVRKALMG